ncbi:4554_t:CDS:2 [Entrophospora sp. SA101]|nr:4554_t:CDS:2 [Entrophospora sp. SA101]
MLDERLSSDLLQVLESTQNYDVLIKVGGGDNLYAEDFNGNNGNDLLEEEFMLEKTLNKCIPLIRYFHISGDDYFKKVFPFKRILPKSLKKDIYGYFLSANYRPKSIILPPRISPIDSTIVTNKHASMIEFWMQNLINSNITIGTTIINNSNPINPITNHGTHSKRLDYDWNLLFRASRDGFTSGDFHSKCDNKGSSIVLIKMRGHPQIIGGYNPVGWYTSRCGYHPTEDSFIFSMNFDENNNFDKCCKLNRVKNSNFAIYHDPSRGPTFGYPDLNQIMSQNLITHIMTLHKFLHSMLMTMKYFR